MTDIIFTQLALVMAFFGQIKIIPTVLKRPASSIRCRSIFRARLRYMYMSVLFIVCVFKLLVVAQMVRSHISGLRQSTH